MNNKFWASALLYDGKLKFWRISPNKKSCPEDFYKDFYYANEKMTDFIDTSLCKVENKLFEINETITHEMIFEQLAPEWFRQWKLIENYKGSKPYLDWPTTRP